MRLLAPTVVYSWLWFLVEGTVSGQTITGPEQLAVKPETVNLGNSISAACSSRELLPERTLSIAWTIGAVDFGECRTVNPGAPGMVCDEGVNITIPYADGITPYAISRISFVPQLSTRRLICLIGGRHDITQFITLREGPSITNLQVTCDQQSQSPRPQWSVRGEADYFQVGSGANLLYCMNINAKFEFIDQ